MRKYFHIIFSLFLIVILSISVMYFSRSFKLWRIQDQRKRALIYYLSELNRYRNEAERRARIINNINRFYNRAGIMGISADNWDHYNVSIEDDFSLADAQRILNQIKNGPFYYFKPESIEIRKIKKGKGIEKESRKAKKDLNIKIKGVFLAKKR